MAPNAWADVKLSEGEMVFLIVIILDHAANSFCLKSC